MIGIGVIGYQVRSRHSLENYALSYPRASIRAIAQDPLASPILLEGKGGPSEVRARAIQLGADFHQDYRSLLQRDDIHLISLMCEPRRAPEIVEEVAAAGKHILSDKPMARNVEEGQRIVAAVRRNKVEMLVGFHTRYAPPFQRAREMLQSGAIGPLRSMHATYLFGGRPEGFLATHDFAASYGGGDLTIAGCYAIDLLRWMACRHVLRVHAFTHSFFFEDYRGIMEDLGQVSLTFEDGILATMVSGRLATPGRIIEVELTGTEGTIHLFGDADTIVLQRQTTEHETYGPPPVELMVHDFLRCLEQGEPSPIPPEEGLACVQVLEAAYASSRTGQAVSMDTVSV